MQNLEYNVLFDKLEFIGIASLVKGRGTVVDGGGILLIFVRNPLATSWPSPL